MNKNNNFWHSPIRNITPVIFLIIVCFISLSCATSATDENNIQIEQVATQDEEMNISFDDEMLPYNVLYETTSSAGMNSSENTVSNDNASTYTSDIKKYGERLDFAKKNELYNESIRFIYLDENEKELNQEIKKIPTTELLELQYQDNIENVNSKKDFFNSIVEYTYSDGKLYDVLVGSSAITDIRLEGGETVSGNIALGESDDYTIETTVSVENGLEVFHFLLKAEDDANETVLIVPTNRRTYYFRLVKARGRSMIGVRFKYKTKNGNSFISEKDRAVSNNYYKNEYKGGMYNVDVRNLSFNYIIESNTSNSPISVFSNESSTFFQFDPRFIYEKSAPSLYLKKDNKLELINYTIRGNLYTTQNIISENESFIFLEGDTMTTVTRSAE